MIQALAARRTFKVIGDPASPAPVPKQDDQVISDILDAAGNAPFHYACDRSHQETLDSPVPWRAYWLNAGQCRRLMERLCESGDVTKVPAMLAAADYLVQVTWLPDPGSNPDLTRIDTDLMFEGTLRNMEHLAAASAFVQSLLLAATDRGYKTYWSSGGALRRGEVFEWISIPQSQILVGSVFLFPEQTGNAEVKAGAMAQKRGETRSWSRKIETV